MTENTHTAAVRDALTPDQLAFLAAAGGAAPSLHNSQPWRFRATGDRRALLVLRDPSRAVPATDPTGRALHVSVGAAVLNLRVAAAALGVEAQLHLLPDPQQLDLLARLDFARPEPDAGPLPDAELYPAVAERHTSRQPFANRDVPEQLVGELMAAADHEGVVLAMLEEYETRRVLALTADAERRTAADAAREAEARSWVRLEAPATDGIPAEALGPLDHDAHVPVRSFTGHPPTSVPRSAHFEALPQLATFTTAHDDRSAWVRTGMALERVWLLATAHGLRASVLHQAVEWPDTRWQLRDPETGPGYVQIILRLGYGPAGAATPRRPVAEILQLS
ncbi:Acg family FMN-binding oxidoreductase [Streptacidiphilus fuscans]|uniref:Nitroreductase family protein n=1 Tax=Streptacidiphilus fuscans TaxID=2789292 RepID=A0A931AYR4_9ACTN|nr:nitroreductase family protein [Streptacidiphilus fuscans]MBF9067033.1 nitroreductase family protein [Streptacidiphilus fuscans]